MKDVTRMFEVAPCLHEIVECARSHFSCGVDDEISLKGRVDCGRGRAAYALVDLKTDVEWDQFKRLVEQASVPYLDVVITSRKTAGREGGIGVIQQEQMQSKGTECADDSDSETFSFDEIKLGTAHDYFPSDVFEMEEAEQDDDDISEGSDGGDDNDGYDNDGYESEGEELERDSAPPLGDSHHVPRRLCAMSYYNQGVKWFIHTGDMVQLEDGVYKPVMQRGRQLSRIVNDAGVPRQAAWRGGVPRLVA
ncbi:hypothetical protein HU200_011513 [Digitaria exilis]|uniref:Uncharacterized protein n=1 Tax=Digitaria exilis TaxID=1010633 RepID=A0A835KP11_9POAL|nr:hypothetical protein HU200_011513 [Digitaria exilis]